eukprot:CAMPEP_0181222700 /NCGR_PEP_ID=MMETSP1096-20121128/30109_1 /TAXON_ID=156174 ORGANISM="Chrysochromulina ericina, Strain CCMP281" /NCGR_SAMPLE_ID=MMETSP1096 /ASSEMBLY_ACC=CAM_ASM_000453 /LENGTH=123 /DNA_ID=CAMNT_0023315485 /DNA_START=494 /DNA_END=862 /DNA_ORIENTATION=-
MTWCAVSAWAGGGSLSPSPGHQALKLDARFNRSRGSSRTKFVSNSPSCWHVEAALTSGSQCPRARSPLASTGSGAATAMSRKSDLSLRSELPTTVLRASAALQTERCLPNASSSSTASRQLVA